MRWLLIAIATVELMTATPWAHAAPGMDEPVPALMPTTPQVPAPQVGNGKVVNNPKAPVVMPDTMSASPAQAPASCQNCQKCQGPGAGAPRSLLKKLKDFVCYYPTAGDALPYLRVHPYNGPYVGTFMCGSPPFSSCGSGKCNNSISTPAQIPGANYGPPSAPLPVNQATIPRQPSDPGMAPQEAPSEEAQPALPLMPPATAPMLPSRGCQGGSNPITIESYQASPQTVGANLRWLPPPSVTIENVEYRAPVAASPATTSVELRSFVAAVPISRQLLTPFEMISPAGRLP